MEKLSRSTLEVAQFHCGPATRPANPRGRLYWAFAGNVHARQLFVVPVTDRQWWAEVGFQWRWYLFRVRAPKQYLGHDPLAQLVMFCMFTLPAAFMIVTGYRMFKE